MIYSTANPAVTAIMYSACASQIASLQDLRALQPPMQWLRQPPHPLTQLPTLFSTTAQMSPTRLWQCPPQPPMSLGQRQTLLSQHKPKELHLYQRQQVLQLPMRCLVSGPPPFLKLKLAQLRLEQVPHTPAPLQMRTRLQLRQPPAWFKWLFKLPRRFPTLVAIHSTLAPSMVSQKLCPPQVCCWSLVFSVLSSGSPLLLQICPTVKR